MHRSKQHLYSITSSARPSSVDFKCAPIVTRSAALLVIDLESYGLPSRHARQSDWLCTGKERNRNVPVFGDLAAHFNVARPRFRDGDAGATVVQCDIPSVVVAQNRYRVAGFFRRIPIPGCKPQQPILSTGNVFADLTLSPDREVADGRLDLIVFYP